MYLRLLALLDPEERRFSVPDEISKTSEMEEEKAVPTVAGDLLALLLDTYLRPFGVSTLSPLRSFSVVKYAFRLGLLPPGDFFMFRRLVDTKTK